MLDENIFTSSVTSRNGQRRFDDIPMPQMPPPAPRPLNDEGYTNIRHAKDDVVVHRGYIALIWQIVT